MARSLATRAMAAALIALIVGVSAAGWLRFVVAAGGTGVADSAAVSAATRASIGKVTRDPLAARESTRVRLTPAEVAWLVALEAASVRARRSDTAATFDQARGRAEVHPDVTAAVIAQSGMSLSPGATNLLGASASGSVGSSTGESSVLVTAQRAAVNGIADESLAVPEGAGSAVPSADTPFLLALLLAAYLAQPGENTALAGAWASAVGHSEVDLSHLIEAVRPSLGSTTGAALAADPLAHSSARAAEFMAIAGFLTSHSTVRSDVPTELSDAVGQTHATATAPRLLSAALAAIGLQRVDAAAVSDATFAMLGVSTVDPASLADSPAMAFTDSDVGAIRELAVAILAAAYVDASYLESVIDAVSKATVGGGLPLTEGVAADQTALTGASIADSTRGKTGARQGDLQRLTDIVAAMLGGKTASDRAGLATLIASALRATDGTSLDDWTRALSGASIGDAVGTVDLAGQGVLLGAADIQALAEQLGLAIAAFDQPGIVEAALATPGLRMPSTAALAASLTARLATDGLSDETILRLMVRTLQARAESSTVALAGVARASPGFAGEDGAMVIDGGRQMVGSGRVDREQIAAALAIAIALADETSVADQAATASGLGKPVVAELWEAIRAQAHGSHASGAILHSGIGVAAMRENAAALGIAELWAAHVGTVGSAFIAGPGSQGSSFVRHDASAIAASSDARVFQRRRDTTRIGASLAVRATRVPVTIPQIRASATVSYVRRRTEPLGLQVAAAFAARKAEIDRSPISELVSFALTANRSPAISPGVTSPETKATDAEPPVASSGGAGAVSEKTPHAIADAQARPSTQPEGPEPVAIVPPQLAASPAARGEVVSVVWPTRAATLRVPEQGVTLNVPVGARSTVFQTRVTVESPDSLEVPPAGEVLRVVRIEIFDALGRPVADAAPEKPLDLIIRLAAQDVERLSGGKPTQQARSELIRLQRFDPEAPEPVWRDVPLRDVGEDEVAASLDHLSLFALVAKRTEAGAPIVEVAAPRTSALLSLVAIVAISGIAFGGVIVLQVAASVLRRRRGRPDG